MVVTLTSTQGLLLREIIRSYAWDFDDRSVEDDAIDEDTFHQCEDLYRIFGGEEELADLEAERTSP